MPVPEHGKVGVKEGEMQRHTENEMEREKGGGRQRERERRKRGYDSQRRGLPFLCGTPQTMKRAYP